MIPFGHWKMANSVNNSLPLLISSLSSISSSFYLLLSIFFFHSLSLSLSFSIAVSLSFSIHHRHRLLCICFAPFHFYLFYKLPSFVQLLTYFISFYLLIFLLQRTCYKCISFFLKKVFIRFTINCIFSYFRKY